MTGDYVELPMAEKLKPIECPTRGFINFPCAICQECEIGAVDLQFDKGILIENTVNSILIHLELPMRKDDPIEKSILDSLKAGLATKISAIQKGTWEGGDISFLLTDEMVKDKSLVENTRRFIYDFPGLWSQLAIEGKRQLTEWSKNNTNKLAHRYFKE